MNFTSAHGFILYPEAPDLQVTPGVESMFAHKNVAVPFGVVTLQFEKYTLHVPPAGQFILAMLGAYLVLVSPLKFLK